MIEWASVERTEIDMYFNIGKRSESQSGWLAESESKSKLSKMKRCYLKLHFNLAKVLSNQKKADAALMTTL